MKHERHTRRQGPRNAAFAALLALSLIAGCGGADDPGPVMTVDARGTSSFDAGQLAAWLSTCPLEPISVAEADSLARMRQEEQLSHDVGAFGAVRWSLPVLARVTSGEATHAAAVRTLLDRYGQDDPLAGLPAGRYADADLQSLHDSLVAAAETSPIEALKAGIQADELGLRDLQLQVAAIDNADIGMVYGLLMSASRNHLRATLTELTRQGGSYQPHYLSPAEFDEIYRGLRKRRG